MLHIAELLGFENYIPPYSTAEGEEILKGVNYASGSAGILKDTGTLLVSNFPLYLLRKSASYSILILFMFLPSKKIFYLTFDFSRNSIYFIQSLISIIMYDKKKLKFGINNLYIVTNQTRSD